VPRVDQLEGGLCLKVSFSARSVGIE